MRAEILIGALVILIYGFGAQASGAIVAGGKTNSAVLIYENKLDKLSNQLILNELGKQLAMGKISGYGTVTDRDGNPVKCAQFGLLQTYAESANLLAAIAEKAGSPDAVQSVGSCRFDTIE